MNYPNPHPEGCFWHGWAEALGAPNIKWCEPTSCSVFSEPANTWSNLAYLVVAGVCLWHLARRPNPTVRWLAPAAALMGSLSFVYHMSNNFLTQLFDFVGMFFWVYLMIAIDLRRLGWLSRAGARAAYWILVVGTSLGVWGLYEVGFKFQLLIALLAAVLIGFEIWLKLRPSGRGTRLRWFVVALLLLGAAETFSLLDVNRIWCQPENVFLHGHVLWHLLSAAGSGFAYLHFHQVRLDDGT